MNVKNSIVNSIQTKTLQWYGTRKAVSYTHLDVYKRQEQTYTLDSFLILVFIIHIQTQMVARTTEVIASLDNSFETIYQFYVTE